MSMEPKVSVIMRLACSRDSVRFKKLSKRPILLSNIYSFQGFPQRFNLGDQCPPLTAPKGHPDKTVDNLGDSYISN